MQRDQSIFVKLKSVDYQYITKTTYSGFYPDCSENDNKQMAKKVFVSGCYDLLHSGHVEFFQQASRYGDLYVGIGSDATYLALVVKDSLKFAENHDEAIHLQIRRA